MRTWKDIREIKIITDQPGIDGWVINLKKNNKAVKNPYRYAMFLVDPGEDDFLEQVLKAIKLQLETGDKWREKV